MSTELPQEFDKKIPDPSKVKGIYIDRAHRTWRGGSNFVVAFNVAGVGSVSFRAPVAEALALAKEKIANFSDVAISISGRADPKIKGNGAIRRLFGQEPAFKTSNPGVAGYQKERTTRFAGSDCKL